MSLRVWAIEFLEKVGRLVSGLQSFPLRLALGSTPNGLEVHLAVDCFNVTVQFRPKTDNTQTSTNQVTDTSFLSWVNIARYPHMDDSLLARAATDRVLLLQARIQIEF